MNEKFIKSSLGAAPRGVKFLRRFYKPKVRRALQIVELQPAASEFIRRPGRKPQIFGA